ncbi:VolA/Pla-1 family phospholipase [Idiomarina sp.]|uniref:VolA/Pla-1 family phospholipase n=1 Tax=Idiomarina sp. TaxID=1874361 RepID=UPI00261C1FEE|nr:VolA/Pla-1 family phospholipase [Idiomarina sp.]
MKKLLLPLAIGSALSLVGCGSGDEAPITENEVNVAATRVVFDPSNGEIPAPTNILLGQNDGTLNLPVDDPSDTEDPFVALNGLDGWGTHSTLTFDFSLPLDENGERVLVDTASIEAQGAVRVFETVQGGNDISEACAAQSPAVVCGIAGELNHNTDFIVKATGEGRGLAVVPVKPFKPDTGYLVVLTDNIQDTLGRRVKASQTYTLMKEPVDEAPASDDPSAQNLQGLINSYEGALAEFVDPENVIYSSNFTTQSVGDVLGAVKLQIANQFQPSLNLTDNGVTLAQAMSAKSDDPEFTPPLTAGLANYYTGSVTLPYYSAHPKSATNSDPTTGRWVAACDSPVAILNALQAENEEDQLSNTDLASLPSGFTEDPSLLLPPNNCFDFDTVGDKPVDPDRFVTKYNPFPAPSTLESVSVWASVPNSVAMPANGWPVVIFQHGITADKSSFFGIAGTLASAGIATVAIDHPLHGDRGFDLDGDGTVEYVASGDNGSATAYMNLESLLTTKSNLKQSISDLLSLRYSLNNVTGTQFDPTKVRFVGHSLGAIAGTSFTQIANATENADFNVEASVLGMPGGSIANFLLESGSFGPVIKSSLMYGRDGFEQFTQAVNGQAEQLGVSPEVVISKPEVAAQLVAGFKEAAGEEQWASVNMELFEAFAFAAQTVVDSADPVNYASDLADNTPVFLIEADGDAVIPNAVDGKPLAGTQPLAKLMGLSDASWNEVPQSTVPAQSTDGSPVSAYASFLGGSHASLLSPEASPAVTTEIQTQIAFWFGSGLTAIPVQNEEVVE